MIVIPVSTEDRNLLIFVLEPKNIISMLRHDPMLMSEINRLPIDMTKTTDVAIAYEDDEQILIQMLKDRCSTSEILEYLGRNSSVHPDRDGTSGIKPIEPIVNKLSFISDKVGSA